MASQELRLACCLTRERREKGRSVNEASSVCVCDRGRNAAESLKHKIHSKVEKILKMIFLFIILY